MKNNPYSKYKNTDVILHEELGIERTILANERNFLAYFRTTLGIIFISLSFIKLLDLNILKIIGNISLLITLTVFIFGIYRFLKISFFINKIIN